MRVPSGSEGERQRLVSRHLTVGWLMLLVFLVLGIVLELFHGLKLRWYVDVMNATRRLMWTLAHAHGVLLGLVNLGFALTVHLRPLTPAARATASSCLIAASVLLPGGFLLGGVVIYSGDPGLGIYLTPVGALSLFWGVVVTLRGLGASAGSETGARHAP